MKSALRILMFSTWTAAMAAPTVRADDAGAGMAAAVSNYVAGVMQGLQAVADRSQRRTHSASRLKPFMDKTPGVFGASLIDTNFVIRQVYFRRDFLAVGYDLKKVRELDCFWKLMREKPAPQLSEPATAASGSRAWWPCAAPLSRMGGS